MKSRDSHATEEELELDKELELEKSNTLSGNPTTHQPHYQPIINYLNEKPVSTINTLLIKHRL